MGEYERKIMKFMLMYVLETKAWDFSVDELNEVTFILGNQELTTADKTPEEVQEMLNQVIRW